MKKVRATFRCKRYGKWKIRQMEIPKTITQNSEACEYVIESLNKELKQDPENIKTVHEIKIKFL